MTLTPPCPTVTASSFQPPQTQNTAPVFEHRCLYTHDLRRKAKRWQDGILRFHTFNKRVMVYDVPRNYIGDTHWREDFPVQDGDEFQLDRPVLVQVGEQVRSIDQDLTGLFEKRQKKDFVTDDAPGSSYSSPPINGRNMGPAIGTKIIPKSLNDLLGTPKGRSGRAMLPANSPFELRNVIGNAGINEERHAKRRRIELPTQRLGLAKGNAILPTGLYQKQAVTSHSAGQSPVSVGKITQHENYPAENSHHKAQNLSYSSNGRATTALGCKKIFPHSLTKANGLDESQVVNPQKRAKNPANKKPQATKESANQPFSGPLSAIDTLTNQDKLVNQSRKREESKTRLQMASHKPRRKLIYRDLLPQLAPDPPNLSSSVVSNDKGNDRISKLESQRNNPNKQYVDEDFLVVERSRERGTSRQGKEGSNLPFPTDIARSENESLQQLTDTQRQINLDHSRSSSPEMAGSRVPKAIPTIHDTNLALARMDEILSSQSQIQKSAARNKAFSDCRGSQSQRQQPSSPALPELPDRIAGDDASPRRDPPEDTDLHGACITQVPSSQLFETQPPVGEEETCSRTRLPQSALQRPAAVKPRSPMKKSVSYTSGITTARLVPFSTSFHASNDDANGQASNAEKQLVNPWSREAWDLFGSGRDGVSVDFAMFCSQQGV